MKRVLLWACCFILAAPQLRGQLAFTGSVLTITENFTNYTSDGFESTANGPTAGQLNSDNWRVTGLNTEYDMAWGSTQTGADFTGSGNLEDWGGTTTGGVQHINRGGGDVVFGLQPSSVDFTRGGIEFRVQNNATSTITLTSIAYDVLVYNDQNRSHYFNSYYSTVDGYDYSINTDATRLANHTLVSSYSSPGSSDDTVYTTSVSESVSIQLDPGDYVYILWEGDLNPGGNGHDEFGLDNVSLGAQVIPEPSTYALIFGAIVLIAVAVKKRRAPLRLAQD